MSDDKRDEWKAYRSSVKLDSEGVALLKALQERARRQFDLAVLCSVMPRDEWTEEMVAHHAAEVESMRYCMECGQLDSHELADKIRAGKVETQRGATQDQVDTDSAWNAALEAAAKIVMGDD